MTIPANGQPAQGQPPTTATLPPEALELASRLFNFARQGSTAALAQYISAGIPPNLTNAQGDTVLMLAAYHGHAETVTALLAEGADVNALNARGQSPLSGAVFKDHQDVVRALVEGGADIRLGQPDSVQTAGMFKRRTCAEIMGVSYEDCLNSLPEGVTLGPHGDMSMS